MLVGSSGHVSQADCHWNFQFESDLAMWPVRKFDWNSNFTSIHRKIFIGILCIVCKRPWPLMEVLSSRDTLCTSRYGLARQAIVAIHSHCLIDLSAPPSNGYKSAKALWAYLILLLSELFFIQKTLSNVVGANLFRKTPFSKVDCHGTIFRAFHWNLNISLPNAICFQKIFTDKTFSD